MDRIWIDKEIDRDSHQSGLSKGYKEIEVDRQEIERNIGGYTKDGVR